MTAGEAPYGAKVTTAAGGMYRLLRPMYHPNYPGARRLVRAAVDLDTNQRVYLAMSQPLASVEPARAVVVSGTGGGAGAG